MKKQTIISAKFLINFLLYSFKGLFLWYTFLLVYFFVIQLWPALVHSKRQAVNLPIIYNHIEKGILTLPQIDYEYVLHIPPASGSFLVFGLPLKFFYIQSIETVLTYAGGLLMIFLIIKMLKSAKEGTFLVAKNAIRLRYIALLNIALLVIGQISFYVSMSYFSDKLKFPGLEFSNEALRAFNGWKYIFLYLFLLIIAEVFRLGAQLKEENDLTI